MNMNVAGLLRADGEDFVRNAYLSLLRREPDEGGRAHYLERLNSGVPKERILAELYLSAEGRQKGVRVDGMDDVVATYQRSAFAPFKFLSKLFSSNASPSLSEAVAPPVPVTDAHLEAPGMPAHEVAVARVEPKPVIPVPVVAPRDEPAVWMDLTATMEWRGGVVGIIRAELEVAHGLKKVHPGIRFSMQRGGGFIEIPQEQMRWLFDADNVAETYIRTVGAQISSEQNDTSGSPCLAEVLNLVAPDNAPLFHPYIAGDAIFSCGWITSQKEAYFSRLKNECPGVYLSYLVYDVILLRKGTSHLYDKQTRDQFAQYLEWVAENVDFILYGGQTAQRDATEIFEERGWRVPHSDFIKLGSDITRAKGAQDDRTILRDIGITGPYLITVGSIEPRKNHDTIYRAYLMALEKNPGKVPQLVICGKPWWSEDLLDALNRDPRLKGVIIRLSPTDEQLAALYRNCLFTLLPSLYEGWSLTLPESLDQGKFCIASDNPPLREVGRDLVEFVPAWDVATWAEKIVFYANNTQALLQRESRISKEWTKTTWLDTAGMIRSKIVNYRANHPATHAEPSIWMDLTTTYLYWHGGVQGIIRAELTYARYLHELAPNTHFFACHNGLMFEISSDNLSWLFNSDDLATSYRHFHEFYKEHEADGTGCRHPFAHGAGPDHPGVLREFPDNSIVFFAAIDWNPSHEMARSHQAVQLARQKKNVTVSQLIYDFTPMLIPHHHMKETADAYEPFIKYSSENFDHLVYGGQTARRDGISFQKSHGWPTPPSDYVEFGSDISESDVVSTRASASADAAVLQRLGVASRFIITVGTLQPRKNQEMLYKAYVTLLEQGHEAELPQMLFIGGKGWNSDDFLKVFSEDERIKGKILLLRPTDAELNVLYRHCLFTLLPSFYEGWSLTLPESLSYGKFCLTSDCDPLRETGRDLVEYINPLDTYRWAERILHYSTHHEEVAAWEDRIRHGWKSRTWRESTEMLLESLRRAHLERGAKR
ncbi:MAG: glycosyltransferase [Burkholderia sp.]|jgi:glycosyltransferase involved in cell wall biosynthesis|uniref:glycosyltransferase n=3 Tax=Burkholderia sp. TaxID=36773 RepID=UPI00258523D0|nr:glycosyltransferase [Burkholderia sp.]MCA3777349.1 glycosyltransferase [Burkholderia sp.]MCA3816083.1 glycosyltransferase [Burkholderia sp.]MCA3851900.1 glycosyltransferase [Burkholderia sp.]MCA3860293.1 glycosyltransferase [Burkholderia sp.]MCA3885636.1 glycosyltransferase [Burkholderia sp.]